MPEGRPPARDGGLQDGAAGDRGAHQTSTLNGVDSLLSSADARGRSGGHHGHWSGRRPKRCLLAAQISGLKNAAIAAKVKERRGALRQKVEAEADLAQYE